MSRQVTLTKQELDPKAVAYAELSDEEAALKVKDLKARIKEIQHTADLSKNPQLIYEARELTQSLAWYRLNKNRSRFFKLTTVGASMRQANRHPDGRSFKRNRKDR